MWTNFLMLNISLKKELMLRKHADTILKTVFNAFYDV